MDSKEIGKILRKLRADRTYEEVALACGITERALYAYELGERIPRDEIKLRLASFYNKSVQEIFFDVKRHDT